MTVTLAVPSKGRIRDEALATLARAGLEPAPLADERSYRTSVPAVPGLEIAFLSASEIARELAARRISLGITGEDLARESTPDFERRMRVEARLGFGHADVVVAVPTPWFDVADMADLADVAAGFRANHGRRLRVATKYRRLTRAHFAASGVRLYRIVESLGATEGAPHSGLADVIVDITSTGSTLRANDLKVPRGGLVLRSEACLIASSPATLSPPSGGGGGRLTDDVIGRIRAAVADDPPR